MRRIEGNTIGVEFDPSGALLASTRLIEGVWTSGTPGPAAGCPPWRGTPGIVTDLAFDADGERVATASDDGSVRVWDPPHGAQQVTLRLAVPLGASTVEFSPDGQRLVTTWADGVTRVWTLDLDELVDLAGERVTRGLTTAECRQYLHTDTCPGA